MRHLDDLLIVALYVAMMVIFTMLLSGCTFQMRGVMKCEGKCELEIERGVDTVAPLPVPKLQLTKKLTSSPPD